jgi:hypothetical protein
MEMGQAFDVLRKVIFAALSVMIVIVAMAEARAHDGHVITNAQYGLPMTQVKPMGRMTQGYAGSAYLYGMNRLGIGQYFLDEINCCKMSGDGMDCHLTQVTDVKLVPGGYEFEGEFIPEAEVTVSPDDNYYRCVKPGAAKSHCAFAPPQGF